ncbi:MAG: hypothetical protein VZR00_10390 [Lachnospiraceae bacterium]|jgi:soluble cytochrome b562|nr:hypothetical protein [Lachnospiraceae bacterium]
MSTIETTVSMLETMPEEAQKKVLLFTQELFTAERPANPFMPKSKEKILSELDESEKQIAEGKCQEASAAIMELKKQHGFV